MNIRSIAKDLLPPLVVRTLRRRSPAPPRNDDLRATGNYASWEAALQDATGYDAPVILERTRAALAQVRDGHAAYERDSVIFSEPDYPFPLVACLLRAAIENDSVLNVLDFGGALGASYYQCRAFLGGLERVSWNIVEQSAHVACGRAEFASDVLRFHDTVADCMREEPRDVLLLSGVVQCLPEPYAFLEEVLAHPFKHVIVDRTPFMCDDSDRLTVERVPSQIYPASFPAWFLSESRFRRAFERRYDLVARFKALDTLEPEGARAHHLGFFFRSKAIATRAG